MLELLPGRLTLNNPVMAASGTFGYGTEFAERVDVRAVGGIVCKGITLQPRAGHPPPRVRETSAGMLNAIGLANIGVDAVIRTKAPLWATLPTPVLVNINGESVDEYTALAERLRDVAGIAGIELNISCPNVQRGGMVFGADPEMAAEVTQAVRAVNPAPLIVKLTPNTANVVAVAEAVVAAGAEAISVANTYLGMAIDIKRRCPALTNVTAGLSGPAIKPLTLRLVYEVAARIDVPIIGIGGIMSGQDALEYLMAGAMAVQVGTANLVDPFAIPRIASELQDWLKREGIHNVREIIGIANPAKGRVRMM
jgi:dihydroorotate dehydrogenase (NAD+) catalytic subunit